MLVISRKQYFESSHPFIQVKLNFNPFMPKLTIFGFFSNNFTDRGYETRSTQFFYL